MLGCVWLNLRHEHQPDSTQALREPFRAVAQAFARFVQSGANLAWPSHSIIVISAPLRTRTTATDPHRQL